MTTKVRTTQGISKPVKAIFLPQDAPSTSDPHLIELENQVQRLMEARLAPKKPIQVNKITSSCKICSGPHDTQYCMENPEQAFVDYASSRTDKAGGKWYTFKPEQNNLGYTYNPSWKSHPNLRLVSNFMASQDARLFKFEADFKQQQSEMTNKIDIVLKAITDRITGALPSDTVKNPKLNVNSTSPVLCARSYPTVDPQCLTQIHGSINTISICPKRSSESQTGKLEEEEQDDKDNSENINTNPSSPHDPSVSFITKKKNDDSHKEEPEIGNFNYVTDFIFVEDISSIIDPRLSQVVLGKPFVEISNMTHDPPEDLEREHTKSVYLRNKEDKRRGVEYVMSKILGFYKECLQLGPEYASGIVDEGEVTLYLMRRSLEVLRKFYWMILEGRYNQLSHVSSLLLRKPEEY
ncbi:hypothetical protein Tco_0046010 [Tanacetum coccineum]